MSDYTDAALRAELATCPSLFRGTIARCEMLLALDASPEVRRELDWEANTRMNYGGGNYSGCLYAAISQWKRSGTFPYRERAARHREAEAAERALTGRFTILPMDAVR